MHLLKTLAILAFLTLAGCQSVPHPGTSGSGATRSLYYSDIPVGSTLTLRQPVTIYAERVTARLPRRGPGSGAGEYATTCKLELWTRNEQTVIVEPDTFVITKVTGGLTPILAGVPTKIVVASLGPLRRLSRGDGGGSSYLRTYAELFLKSPRQPDVYRITCGYMNDPWEVNPLTIAELRGALSGVATLNLAM